MTYLVIVILALSVIAMCFTLKKLMKELNYSEELLSMQTKRANKYFDEICKYRRTFRYIEKVILSDLLTIDKYEQIKESVAHFHTNN